MATLEKIRSKSVLLLVVIGVALLAFIIGDFLNSSRTIFGPDSSVATVNGEKIEAAEFQNRQSAMNASASTDDQRAFQDQNLLGQMLLEKLRNKEFEKLGLTVTDAELNDAVNGENKAQADYMASYFAMQYLGQAGGMTAAELYEITNNNPSITDVEQKNAYKQLWLNYEQMLAEQLLNNKFMRMLDGTMTANKLDIEQLFKDQNTGVSVKYVTAIYPNDATVAVEDAELQALWEADKANYELEEESRLVSMISLPIVPSVSDEAAARASVKEVVDALNATPELEGVRGKKGFQSQRMTMTNAFIAEQVKRGGNSKLKDFADTAKVGTATIIEDGVNYNFQIAKLLNRASEVDSVMINFVVYSTADAAIADSVKAAVAAGKTAAEIADEERGILAFDSVKTSLTNPAAPEIANLGLGSAIASARQAIIDAEIGKPFVADTLSNSPYRILYTVVKRNAPQSNVDIALVSYTLEPSKETVENLRAKLEQYIAENGTADKFFENAAAANLRCNYYDISATSPFAQDPTTRQIVPVSNKAGVWALEAEKGAVSPVFGDQRTGAYIVAAVNNIFTDYRTIEDPRVKEDLTAKARNAKEAEALIAKYQGKASDLEGYAKEMNTTVSNGVSYIAMQHDNFGSELLGKIMTTPQGAIVGPVKGKNGVVVFQVDSITAPVRPVDMKNDANTFNVSRGAGAIVNNPGNFFEMLLGNEKIQNNLTKGFRRD